ncbi:uncharacterized protein LOC142981789 [Anticarsia gemmatalis]|uniref:uncharacterized protein LOC142981789 n=1 Tax=Anticarsia gemmatalis TaxID=129554 RepID=UPI003F7711EF
MGLYKIKEIVVLLLFLISVIPVFESTKNELGEDNPVWDEIELSALVDNFDDFRVNFTRRTDSIKFIPQILVYPWENVYWYMKSYTKSYDLTFSNFDGTTKMRTHFCYFIVTTYTGAMVELRRYLELRYTYRNSTDFEVGYMVHEIIAKYQRLLELFYIVRKKFSKYKFRFKAPSSYMAIMYTNILDVSQMIIHLCNMLHEVEIKGTHKKRYMGIKPADHSDSEKESEEETPVVGTGGGPQYRRDGMQIPGGMSLDRRHLTGSQDVRDNQMRGKMADLRRRGVDSQNLPLTHDEYDEQNMPVKARGWSVEDW